MLLSKSSNEIGYFRDYLQTIHTVVALEQSLSQISKIRNYNFVLENFLEFIVKTVKIRMYNLLSEFWKIHTPITVNSFYIFQLFHILFISIFLRVCET